jgi:hypothetical protein
MDDVTQTVDMSSAALDRRLKSLSGLYKLGMSLKKAKPEIQGGPRDTQNKGFISSGEVVRT